MDNASFLSGEDLENRLKIALGANFKKESIKQAAYELSLGSEVFRTDSKDGKIEILDDKNKIVEINAGQFCLLLTKETITIPRDILAFISMKANEKFKGLINVSGFHIDPGFNGQILFSVYNAGPSTISLKLGEPYFLIWFSKLSKELTDNEAYNNKTNTHQNQHGIPTRYMDALKRGELTSPSAIVSKIKEVDNEQKNEIKEVARKVQIDLKAIENKKNYNQYLLILVVGLLATLGVKLFWDNKAEDYGYEKRIKEEALIQEIKSAFGYPIDTNFLKQVDSIMDQKIKLINNKSDTTQ